MAKNYVVEHIDFAGIGKKLAALSPTTMTAEEVLARLGPHLAAARQRGVSCQQLAAALRSEGISVRARQVQVAIERGEGVKRESAPAEVPESDDDG